MNPGNAALARVLLVAHAVAAGALAGSSTHLALQAIQLLRDRAIPRLLRIYPIVAFWAWTFVTLSGAVMYPRYRILVRRDHLDTYAVWASILFDVKENLAVFVGPLLAGAWWFTRDGVKDLDAETRRWFAVLCVSAGTIVWWNVVSGLLVTSVRSV